MSYLLTHTLAIFKQMYYSKNPFLKVGLPFLTAMVFGTFFLVDVRKSGYEAKHMADFKSERNEKRTMKSLEDELREWEEKHKKKLEEFRGNDYEMKPVK